MELSSLKTFVAVVDESGIQGAADQLHTVKSNITTRIQRLEAELETKLFEKKGRRLQLTPSGKALYEYANQMIQLERQARTKVRMTSNSYELHIGSPEPFAAVHLPKALQHLRHYHQHIQPKIHTATTAELTQGVLNRRIDCAIVGGAPTHPDLESTLIVTETVVMVNALNYPDPETLIVRHEGCAYRSHALAWHEKSGRSYQSMMTMNTVDGLLGCVAGGLGYSVITQEMINNSRYEEQLSVEPMPESDSRIDIYLIHRKDAIPLDGIKTLAAFYSNS